MQRFLQVFRESYGRCYFYHFLEAPLYGTVSLIQVERRLAITENLDFDVARGLDIPLHKHGSIPKGRQRFRLRPREVFLQFGRRADNAHASTAAAVRRFHDHGIADRIVAVLDEAPDLFVRVAFPIRAWDYGHARINGQLSRQRLVAEFVQYGRFRSHERDAVRLTESREVHVLDRNP